MKFKARMNPRWIKSNVWFLLLFLALLLTGCGALGSIETPTPTSTSTATATPTRTLTPTPTLTPTATPIPPACGGPRVMIILLIGSDSRRDDYNAGLADAIRLVRVDFVEPGIRLLSFPRDLYVEISGISDHKGITHGKLNQAYLYGNPGYGYYDGPGQGPGLLANTIDHNFGIRVDHYAAVNLQTFVQIVDKLGGIDIQMPYTLDGRVPGSKDLNRYFPAGSQHLNGYRTMLLARMRPQGDFQRLEIQNIILRTLARKLYSPGVLLQLPDLIKTFYISVQTDLGSDEISQLACLAALLNAQDIEFERFPEDLYTVSRVQDPVLGYTSILDANVEVLKSYVKKFKAGISFSGEDDEWISP